MKVGSANPEAAGLALDFIDGIENNELNDSGLTGKYWVTRSMFWQA